MGCVECACRGGSFRLSRWRAVRCCIVSRVYEALKKCDVLKIPFYDAKRSSEEKMKELFYQDAAAFFQGMPSDLFVVFLGVFIVGTVIFCVTKGLKEWLRLSAGLLLFEYVVLFFCSAVLFRPSDYPWEHYLTPFSSYEEMIGGRMDLVSDAFYNVLFFLPIGFLLKIFKSSLSWWIVLIIGLMLSFLIEGLQYAFNKGFCEFDDVFHNTVGGMLGYCLCVIVRKIRERVMV